MAFIIIKQIKTYRRKTNEEKISEKNLRDFLYSLNLNDNPEETSDGRSNFEKNTTTLFAKLYDSLTASYTDNPKAFISYVLSCILLVDNIVLFIRLLIFLSILNTQFLTHNVLYITFFSISPFLLWIESTEIEYWNYRRRKSYLFNLCVLHCILIFLHPILRCSTSIVFPLFSLIKVGHFFTTTLIGWTARLFCFVIILLFVVPVVQGLSSSLYKEEFFSKIMVFKLHHIIDMRPNKENLYDCTVAYDLESGQPVTLLENDRYTHCLVVGSSGTGKTSTILYRIILNDLTTKRNNDDARQKALLQMVLDNKAGIQLPDGYQKENEFQDSFIKPYPSYEREYEEILKKYRTCSVIVLSPNTDLADGTMDLAISRGYHPKLIDPTLKTGNDSIRLKKYSDLCVGFNPLYQDLNSTLDLLTEAVNISSTATNFTEILTAVDTAQEGSSDRFFSNINRNLTANICKTLLLYGKYILHRQVTVKDFQHIINDLSSVFDILEQLEEIFGYIVFSSINLPDKRSSIYPRFQKLVNRVTDIDKYGNLIGLPGKLGKRLTETPWHELFLDLYQNLLLHLEKYNEYSTGLRNIVNEFLQDPCIEKIYLEDEIIDMDAAMEKGEIIVLNYAYERGNIPSMSLALSFQLLFNQALFRRSGNKDTRGPVFETVDELPLLLANGNWLATLLSLGRQYGCSFTGALQTLDQMEKNTQTKYLKLLILCAGTQIVFGRAGSSEMTLYSKLSGTMQEMQTQESVSQTSMLDVNPRYSYTSRQVATERPYMKESDIRKKDFLECTVFTYQQGRVLDAIPATGKFLTSAERKPMERFQIDWSLLQEKHPFSLEAYQAMVLGKFVSNRSDNEVLSNTTTNMASVMSEAKENNTDSSLDFSPPIPPSDSAESDIWKIPSYTEMAEKDLENPFFSKSIQEENTLPNSILDFAPPKKNLKEKENFI